MVTLKKEDLLDVLKKNREAHNNIFLDAQKGYREEAIRLLDKALENARNGNTIKTMIHLDTPVDQTKDYDRIIRMLEMSIDEEVDLSEHDFAQYVLDGS